jgi:hypothetical protein
VLAIISRAISGSKILAMFDPVSGEALANPWRKDWLYNDAVDGKPYLAVSILSLLDESTITRAGWCEDVIPRLLHRWLDFDRRRCRWVG